MAPGCSAAVASGPTPRAVAERRAPRRPRARRRRRRAGRRVRAHRVPARPRAPSPSPSPSPTPAPTQPPTPTPGPTAPPRPRPTPDPRSSTQRLRAPRSSNIDTAISNLIGQGQITASAADGAAARTCSRSTQSLERARVRGRGDRRGGARAADRGADRRRRDGPARPSCFRRWASSDRRCRTPVRTRVSRGGPTISPARTPSARRSARRAGALAHLGPDHHADDDRQDQRDHAQEPQEHRGPIVDRGRHRGAVGGSRRRARPACAIGRCHRLPSVGTRPGTSRKPSHRPASSPPTWAALSMPPPTPARPNPNSRLMRIRPPICPSSIWPRRSSTGWCVRETASSTPNSPNTAPDAPTDGMSPPNR